MRVAIIGRTLPLLQAAEAILADGHRIGAVWSCGAEGYYGAGPGAFRALAERCDAPFHHEPKLNQSFADAEGCELAVSLGWPTRIAPRVLGAFPKGVINGHAGDLPRYQGAAAANWALLAGESRIGLCVHFMAAEYDSGAVLLRRHFELGADTYIGEFYEWYDRTIPSMLREAVNGIAENKLKGEPRRDVMPLRCYPRRPADSRIDWRRPVDEIYRLVRASSRPFDGAWTTFEGDRAVKIWRGTPAKHPGDWLAVPGTVCFVENGDPVVACADGMFRLTEIETTGQEQAEMKALLGRSARNRLE